MYIELNMPIKGTKVQGSYQAGYGHSTLVPCHIPGLYYLQMTNSLSHGTINTGPCPSLFSLERHDKDPRIIFEMRAKTLSMVHSGSIFFSRIFLT